MEPKRCGVCDNCLQIEQMKGIMIKAINQDTLNILSGKTQDNSVADSVREVWNQSLEDYPCTNPEK